MEGERLSEENGMLQRRLKELKQIERAENERKNLLEMQAQENREHLEAVQDELEDQ